MVFRSIASATVAFEMISSAGGGGNGKSDVSECVGDNGILLSVLVSAIGMIVNGFGGNGIVVGVGVGDSGDGGVVVVAIDLVLPLAINLPTLFVPFNAFFSLRRFSSIVVMILPACVLKSSTDASIFNFCTDCESISVAWPGSYSCASRPLAWLPLVDGDFFTVFAWLLLLLVNNDGFANNGGDTAHGIPISFRK